MKILFILLSLLGLSLAQATSSQEYVTRFMDYTNWSQHLPQEATPAFLTFIADDTPLAKKLREKWLYQLAKQKNWASFQKYYHPSDDQSLQCFFYLSNYYQGQTQQALNAAKQLWLSSAYSEPPACNELFSLLLKSNFFDAQLISQRLRLALDKRNLPLVRYLLKQYKPPRLNDEQWLISVYQNPARITQLPTSELHDAFYLYGLKRLVSVNMTQALQAWQNAAKQLTPDQQQAFLAHVALYKAMRNQDDAYAWFMKVKPPYYNDVLLDWQIRFALKRKQWTRVEHLINFFQNKRDPCWQYWLARAKEATGHSEEARAIYQALAKTRQYYGFLASLRLHQPFSFTNEKPANNFSLLTPYQPILITLKSLYLSHQTVQAARLLTDFISELPKNDKSALLSWVANELGWYGKSLYLSNTPELTNQLALRFPQPYGNLIHFYAQHYHLPPEFIYAIIRQESGFRDDAVSSVGALGLMQVMPDTAYLMANKEKISYTNKHQLFLSQKNINFGTAYLQLLATRFNHHPTLIAAAYNAGPNQVSHWIKQYPPKDMTLWIETLPWHETRNYLKNVISFYAVYQYLMQHPSNLHAFMQPG